MHTKAKGPTPIENEKYVLNTPFEYTMVAALFTAMTTQQSELILM